MTYFYCTGFGKFGNIMTNPTTKLVEALPALLSQCEENEKILKLQHHEVVTTAIQDCDEAIQRIYTVVQDNHGEPDRHIIIHFGVYDGSTRFALETLGKNIKNFGIPDERGACP